MRAHRKSRNPENGKKSGNREKSRKKTIQVIQKNGERNERRFAGTRADGSHDYAPIPFWSWNNRLEKDKLIRQIGDMQSAGCGGFIIHARTGLTTEYLSEEWFSLVEACLDEAKKRGMHAWIYDENGWPSGFVGGELLKEEENLACYLTEEDKDSYDPEAFAVFSGRGGSAGGFRRGSRAPTGCIATFMSGGLPPIRIFSILRW